MIILGNTNLPHFTVFFIEKKNFFLFKMLTFEESNGTLFLPNADFHREDNF